MPRYYFDLLDGEQLTRDEVGVELDADATARNAAANVFTDLAREAGSAGTSQSVLVRVRDQSGDTLLEVAVPVPQGPKAIGSPMTSVRPQSKQ